LLFFHFVVRTTVIPAPSDPHFVQQSHLKLRSECSETIRGADGMALPVGNCLGGATTFNLGMYIEEHPSWIVEHLGEGFGTEAEVADAFEWVSPVSLRICPSWLF
jgi:membrane protein YqaA with SNARE-associated domain